MDNLPLELQAIKPPTSTKECVDIATTILQFNNAVDKYKVYQAQNFFMNNIKAFSKDEFEQIIKNKLFVRKYVGQSAYDILNFCVQNEITYPIVLNSWFDKKVFYSQQEKYVLLLNKEDNKEQIKAFNEQLPNLVNRLITEIENPCSTFIEIILKKEPENIFKIKSWTDDMIANWLKTNTNNSRKILYRTVHRNGLDAFPKSKKQLYKNIVEEFLNMNPETKESYSKDNFNFEYTYHGYPIDYIHFLEDNYPDLFKKTINLKLKPIIKEQSVVLNGLQMMLLTRDDTLGNSIQTFSKYKELVKQEVEVEIGFYKKRIHFFEQCMTIRNFKPLALFNLKDDLNSEEKEMLVASAFMSLNDNHTDLPMNNHLKTNKNPKEWYFEIIKECSDQQFEYYSKKIKSSLKMYPKLAKEYETLELFRTLEKNPDNTNVKKLKV